MQCKLQTEGEKEQALGRARARLKEVQDLRKEVSSVIEKKRRVGCEVAGGQGPAGESSARA